MSIVIGKITPKGFIVGADSAVTFPDDTQHVEDGVKLFQVGPMITGFVGHAEHASVLRYVLEEINDDQGFPKEPNTRNITDIYHIYAKSAAEEFGVSLRGISEDGLTGPADAIMIALHGKVFVLSGYQVQEVRDVHAMGCGSSFAYGALFAQGTLEQAFGASCKYSIHCNYPIIIYEEENNKIDRRVLMA